MARSLFPNERFVAGTIQGSTLLRLVDGMKFEVYEDSACTTLADIVDLGLQSTPFITAVDSSLQSFYGPDDWTTPLYIRVKDTTLESYPIYAYNGGGGGSGGSSSYVHHQDTPAATWTITHGLGYPPNVTVVDSTGRELKVAIQYPLDAITQTVLIQFNGASSGQAYLS